MLISRTLGAVSLFAIAGSICTAADGPSLITLDRLRAVHHTETIAQERYLAFAVKADEEGYKQVASLFRAVARAEQILYTFHFDAIKELGGVPEDFVGEQSLTVGTTRENIEKSLDKAAADRLDAEFATYVKTARAEGYRNAAKVFEYARSVETQNIRLFTAAAKGLEQMRNGPKPYYICGVSGVVTATLDQASCAGSDWERVR